jgi:hypothetical protein
MVKTIIYEPMTTITDLIIAFMAFYYARELTTIYINQLLNVQYHWIWTFRMLGLGALFGALSHGIGPYCSPLIAAIIWKFTTYSIGAMSYFMAMSMLHHLFEYDLAIRLKWVMMLFLVIYLYFMTRNDDFLYVILFYVPLMIIVLIGFMYSYINFNSDGSTMLMMGVLISFIGAGVQQSGIALHEHMNYNDIAHIIQMVALWYFYQGSLVVKDGII